MRSFWFLLWAALFGALLFFAIALTRSSSEKVWDELAFALAMNAGLGISLASIFRPNWLAKRGEAPTEAQNAKTKKNGVYILIILAFQLAFWFGT
jgi:hypothetical protein